MNNNGWIKLHRKILESPIIMKDPDHIAIWVWLLLNVTHTVKKVDFAGKIISLQPGQLTCGRQQIAEGSKVDRSKVERVLNLLKSEQQIEQQTTNKCRLITVINWIQYQQVEQQSEQPVSNNRATSEQPVSTKQEDKECKEGEEGKTFEKFWAAYPKKTNRIEAMMAWNNIISQDHQIIMEVIPAHIRSKQWTDDDGRYIPNPARWLMLRRWEDTLEEPKIKKKPEPRFKTKEEQDQYNLLQIQKHEDARIASQNAVRTGNLKNAVIEQQIV